MPLQPDDLAETALAHLLALPSGRKLVAVAGPPGAGKSTVAGLLAERLRSLGRVAAVVPMDGFHLDNRLLDQWGLRAQKGAPQTFDAAGFAALMVRMARRERGVVYPVFDRGRDIAIAGAAILPDETEFVLVEGNYLLLREAPWSGLASHWDYAIWVDAPLVTLQERLMRRWLDDGMAPTAARARVEGNDLPNVRLTRTGSRQADLVLGDGD